MFRTNFKPDFGLSSDENNNTNNQLNNSNEILYENLSLNNLGNPRDYIITEKEKSNSQQWQALEAPSTNEISNPSFLFLNSNLPLMPHSQIRTPLQSYLLTPSFQHLPYPYQSQLHQYYLPLQTQQPNYVQPQQIAYFQQHNYTQLQPNTYLQAKNFVQYNPQQISYWAQQNTQIPKPNLPHKSRPSTCTSTLFNENSGKLKKQKRIENEIKNTSPNDSSKFPVKEFQKFLMQHPVAITILEEKNISLEKYLKCSPGCN